MSLDFAIRMTEMLAALAFLQQSLEHMHAPGEERRLFLLRSIFSVFLFFGFQARWVCLGSLILNMFILKRFQGPYNGGSDRMGLLILSCLTLLLFMPALRWREVIFGYLALQLTLSYFIAGWVKIVNPEWRSGRALRDVFQFSAYPVSESLRSWADWPRTLWLASWMVISLEMLFPFTLLARNALIAALSITAAFHLANACLFGLNRFLWVWLTAYPSILWFQERIFFR